MATAVEYLRQNMRDRPTEGADTAAVRRGDSCQSRPEFIKQVVILHFVHDSIIVC